jgi:cytochrome c oxidase cbb3-type subunit 3
MSNVLSWYIIVGTVVSLVACFWLVAYANKQRASDAEIKESEGHVWDENIRELNNPLPMWWLWLFVGTIIWSAGYLIWYPGLGGFSGVGGWSQEKQYADEVAAAEAQYAPMFAEFGAMDFDTLAKNEAALSIGFSLFQNYCSQCHGSGAQGARGFPNLTDADWLYGGEPAQIEQSILAGRAGVMPPLGAVFGSDEAIDEMVRYVQGIPDGMDTSSPAHTRYMQLCIACHGPDGGGMQALGAPSLKDDIWLYGSSPAQIRKTIVEGRNGVMPAHGNLIGPDRARILAAYVYSLSQ